MSALASLLKRLRSERHGIAATEFGLIAIPFAIVMMGAFDVGYQMYVRSVLDGTLAEVARRTSVEDPNFSGSGTLQQRVEAELKGEINSIARNATYTVEIRNFTDFSGIGKPEKLTTDVDGNGQYDEEDGDCWEDLNGNGTYDTAAGRTGFGGASDVVHYIVTLEMPRMFPLASLLGASEKYNMRAETVFRTQPYSTQEVSNIECGGVE